MQAPAPTRLIPSGLPTEATVAHVLASKYADHLPLYRQSQIMARQGINLDRSALADWVGRATYELRPVFDALTADLKRLFFVFADKHDHAWRQHIDISSIDFGKGDRALTPGGRLHPVSTASQSRPT